MLQAQPLAWSSFFVCEVWVLCCSGGDVVWFLLVPEQMAMTPCCVSGFAGSAAGFGYGYGVPMATYGVSRCAPIAGAGMYGGGMRWY